MATKVTDQEIDRALQNAFDLLDNHGNKRKRWMKWALKQKAADGEYLFCMWGAVNEVTQGNRSLRYQTKKRLAKVIDPLTQNYEGTIANFNDSTSTTWVKVRNTLKKAIKTNDR